MQNKIANIPKFKGKFKQEKSGCTVIVNATIQSITDVTSLAVYTYLSTKPPSWKICPQEIRNHFGLGRDKVWSCFNDLISRGLMIKEEHREKGKFVSVSYKLKLKPLTENQGTAEKTASKTENKPNFNAQYHEYLNDKISLKKLGLSQEEPLSLEEWMETLS